MSESRIRFRNHDDVRSLFGTRDGNLRRLRDQFDINVTLRGDELHLVGDAEKVERGAHVVRELRALIEKQGYLPPDDFDRILLRRNGGEGESSGGIEVYHKARLIQPMGPGQAKYIQSIRNHDLVFCTGPAGSGKTYLATAMAVNALRQETVRKVVLVRPAVEAGEKLGFLPGDMLAKVNPYLRPLLDAMGDILDFDQVQRYIEKDIIEIAPLAFMRGRTLNNTFIILDEGQNTTITQMKMFLTRMGQHSKIVVTGDVTQTDLPEHVPSGLNDAVQRLRNVPGVGVIQLSGEDIVRHPLVRRIVAAYDADRPQAETRVESQESRASEAPAGSRPSGSGLSSLDS